MPSKKLKEPSDRAGDAEDVVETDGEHSALVLALAEVEPTLRLGFVGVVLVAPWICSHLFGTWLVAPSRVAGVCDGDGAAGVWDLGACC